MTDKDQSLAPPEQPNPNELHLKSASSLVVNDQSVEKLPTLSSPPLVQLNSTELHLKSAPSFVDSDQSVEELPTLSSPPLVQPNSTELLLKSASSLVDNDQSVEKLPTPSSPTLVQPNSTELHLKSAPSFVDSDQSVEELPTLSSPPVVQPNSTELHLKSASSLVVNDQSVDELLTPSSPPLMQPNSTEFLLKSASSLVDSDQSVEKLPTLSSPPVVQPNSTELQSITTPSLAQPSLSDESVHIRTLSAEDVDGYRLETENLSTRIPKEVSTQEFQPYINNMPPTSSLPLEQSNLTCLQSEIMQSHAQPSIPDESVDTKTLPAEDTEDCQLETKRPSKRILNESSEQESQLKMTSSNAESVKSNASILSVEDAHDDQLEPPSKKIRSETPTQELAKVALLERLNNPKYWSIQCDETQEVEIPKGTSEYNKIRNYLSVELWKQLRICRLQNPYSYHRYMLKKAEYIARDIQVHEETLLHATASHKVDSILKNNLDWRLVSRDKYGRGVSFSHSSLYANQECNKRNGSKRAMLIVKVLIGKKCAGSQCLKLPPNDYDTTTGNTNVFVKFYDDEFYPEYVVYYSL